MKFYVKKVEASPKDGEMYITVIKKHPFVTYLRLICSLDKNDWKNDMYIDDYTAEAYQILISKGVWDKVKDDINFVGVPITTYVFPNSRYQTSYKERHIRDYGY